MREFLAAIRDLSPQEAEVATGISWMSISNYRKGEWTRLIARVQRMMRAYLGGRPAGAGQGWDEGYRAAVERMETALAAIKARAP